MPNPKCQPFTGLCRNGSYYSSRSSGDQTLHTTTSSPTARFWQSLHRPHSCQFQPYYDSADAAETPNGLDIEKISTFLSSGVRGTGKSDKEGFYKAAFWLHQNHPKTLACNATDMEFDEASENNWETDYEAIRRKFKEKGVWGCGAANCLLESEALKLYAGVRDTTRSGASVWLLQEYAQVVHE
ncbi:hypothetical protein C1H46_004148 [Malus baccata]|uniref:DUF2828 domain-containing protein n=1 Tax=Malus baccata TaxID=106549 RepID=A0A540NH21_MALBA|nr:hypothetical protein C1H46_004148 [Malus baccata]